MCPEGSLYGASGCVCVSGRQQFGCVRLWVGRVCMWIAERPLYRWGEKGNIMDNKKKCAKSSSMSGQPSVDRKNEYRNGGVVTQLTPDDLMTDESFRRSGNKADGTPTDQQLNQEVTALNPSVESMDGRG